MSDDAPVESELDDGLGLQEFELLPPPRRQYDGWHLPRKQMIRHSQWSEPLRDIVAARADPRGPIRYLGLPGADLLDLHHFHRQLCVPTGHQLRFIGFDRAARTQDEGNTLINTVFADLIRDPLVEDGSHLYGDDLYQIIDKSSVPFREVQRKAPFDVVNLDFCKPVVGEDMSTTEGFYALIKRIFLIQRTNDPWLLLLTSRVSFDSFATGTLEQLLRLLEACRDSCAGFNEALLRAIEVVKPLTAPEAEKLDREQFFKIASSLAGLWIVGTAGETACRITLVNAVGYAVHGDDLDMLSLSIKVEPNYDLTQASPASDASNEAECAQKSRVLSTILSLDNLDEYLRSNPAWSERSTRESVALMKSANHPIGPYLEWLADKGVDVSIIEEELHSG